MVIWQGAISYRIPCNFGATQAVFQLPHEAVPFDGRKSSWLELLFAGAECGEFI